MYFSDTVQDEVSGVWLKMNSLSGDGGELLVIDRPPDLALVPLRSHVERARQVR